MITKYFNDILNKGGPVRKIFTNSRENLDRNLSLQCCHCINMYFVNSTRRSKDEWRKFAAVHVEFFMRVSEVHLRLACGEKDNEQ